MKQLRSKGIWMFLLLPLLLGAKDVYVSSHQGTDANDGLSRERPLGTLAKSVALLEPGDTLHILPGSHFYESLVFRRSGTPWEPITVEGNGAVVSGLKDLSGEKWEERGDGVYFLPMKFKFGALMPFVIDGGGVMLPRRKPEELQIGDSAWTQDGIYVRCKAGESPAAMGLQGTCRVSGVVFENQSYITVRNLVAEYNANDGYNVHGYCRGLVFEQIVSRYNGDDGFSVHEDVQALVRGGHFHHNDFGIQDINVSRTQFQGLLVEENRVIGVHFNGGARSLEDSIVRNNARMEICIQGNKAEHIGYGADDPMAQGVAFLRNVAVLNGKVGLQVVGPARVSASNLAILDCGDGVALRKAGELHLQASAVAGSKRFACLLEEHSRFSAKANAYFPDRFQLVGREVGNLKAFQEATGQEAESLAEEPRFRERFAGAKRIPCGKVNHILGPCEELIHPQEVEVPERYLIGGRPKGPDGKGILFDFEVDNPWNRLYPEPEQDKEGGKPVLSAEVSTEQAVSGRHSLKLQFQFPQTNMAAWKIKLFSQSLTEWKKEVHGMGFQLYVTVPGGRLVPRLRDAAGKSFQGPAIPIDWIGWKRILWNLDEVPPTILGRDKEKQQRPPFEAVIDFYLPTGAKAFYGLCGRFAALLKAVAWNPGPIVAGVGWTLLEKCDFP